jgi:hypothetical protein
MGASKARVHAAGRNPSVESSRIPAVRTAITKMAKFTPGVCPQNKKSKAHPSRRTAIQNLLEFLTIRASFFDYAKDRRFVLSEAIKKYQIVLNGHRII